MKLFASLAVLALSFAGNAVAQPQFGRPGSFGPPKNGPPNFGPPSRGPSSQPGRPQGPPTTTKAAAPPPSAKGNTAATTSASSSTSSTTSSSSAGPSVPVVVQSPAANPGTCNTAADRTKWCNGYTIGTDAYQTWPTTGNTCSYNFAISNTTISFDGTPKMALAINGQVPGPTIECQWGDTVSITVTNNLSNNGTTIHWHGIRQLLTGYADGVPGITECPLAPGQTKTYTWVATQYGTSWYHSHYATQYADGVRGPIIIHGPATANYDVDMGQVMVEDLFYQTAAQVYYEISHTGPQPAQNYMLNGKNRKVDLSGGAHALWQVTSGQKYLFRIVNSAAQNMWWMHFDNHNMTVIAMDNVPIVPYTTDWLAIGIGQRYDVIITANQPVGNYFFRAVSQTSCANVASDLNTGLGSANGILQYSGAATTLPTTSPGTSRTNFATCQDEPLASLVPYVSRSAGSSSAFSASVSTLPVSPVTSVQTSDDGAVFKWFINNGAINVNWTQPTIQSLAQGNSSAISNAITLPNGNTWVYFVIQNQFPSGHPMHLHGHDFALLGQGLGSFSSSQVSSLNFVNPARRDTTMLLGSGYTIIGFETDNPGSWLMHCHIAWHVDGGLALQYVEVPSQIPAATWVASNGFQNQCSKYEAYEAAGGAKKTGGESGLKVRREYDETDNAMVRRSGSERQFLDAYKARHGAHF